jgi:hypothetical protein
MPSMSAFVSLERLNLDGEVVSTNVRLPEHLIERVGGCYRETLPATLLDQAASPRARVDLTAVVTGWVL